MRNIKRVDKFLVLVILLFIVSIPTTNNFDTSYDDSIIIEWIDYYTNWDNSTTKQWNLSQEGNTNFKILSFEVNINVDIVGLDILVNASWINYIVEDDNIVKMDQTIYQGYAPIGIVVYFRQSYSVGTHNCSVTINDLKDGVPYNNTIVLNFSYTVLGLGEVVNEPVDRFVFEPITFEPITFDPTPSFPYMVCGYIILGLLLALFTVAILNYRTPLHKGEKTTHDIRVDVITSGDYVLVDSDKEDMKSDFDKEFPVGQSPYGKIFDDIEVCDLEPGTWGSRDKAQILGTLDASWSLQGPVMRDEVIEEDSTTVRCYYCGTPNTKPVTRCKYCGGSF